MSVVYRPLGALFRGHQWDLLDGGLLLAHCSPSLCWWYRGAYETCSTEPLPAAGPARTSRLAPRYSAEDCWQAAWHWWWIDSDRHRVWIQARRCTVWNV